jgi:O-methyltransferase
MLTNVMGGVYRMVTGTRRHPPEPPPDLEKTIHALHQCGGLSRLTRNQVDHTLQALRESGRLDHVYTEAGYPRVTAEQLDHVVHAMRLNGELARLANSQIDNILYALHAAGHLQHLRDVSRAAYDDGHLISFHNADFLRDPRFIEAYRLGQNTNSWQGFDIRWRTHVLCWAAAHATSLAGDFVECGVNRGGFSRAVMHYIDFGRLANRRFYLLDTYCGIPEQDRETASDCYHNAYSECYQEVVETFRPFPNAYVIRGRVPDTLPQVPSDQVCYLSIDMNCVGPEIAAAEFFWDKLVPGAVVLLDDYGAGVWHLPQKHAFDAFARGKGVEILTLPTCQGLLVKP